MVGKDLPIDSPYDEEPWWKGPVKYVIMIFLLLLIIIWPGSYYAGKVDPSPHSIPLREDVIVDDMTFGNVSLTIDDIHSVARPYDQQIKLIADKIASFSCDGSKICHAKAIYYFVRDRYKYIADPINSEYIEDPKEFLSVGGGDCESGSIAMAVLMEAVGIDSELVLIPGHAYVRIKMPEAKLRYRAGDYVYLDWTCKTCEFGKVPVQDIGAEADYLQIY